MGETLSIVAKKKETINTLYTFIYPYLSNLNRFIIKNKWFVYLIQPFVNIYRKMRSFFIK
jgi:hypothetical protein